MPGARLIGTFQHNSDLNSYLEHVGPTQANQFAAQTSSPTRSSPCPIPTGGMSAYSVPIGWQNQAIGPGHTVHQVMTDVDGNLKITAIPAPESMTRATSTPGRRRRQASGRVQDAGPRTIRQEASHRHLEVGGVKELRRGRCQPRQRRASRPRLRSTPTIRSNRPPS